MIVPWTVLIVDDSKADRVVYQRYLKRSLQQDYDFLEANCAEQGLALCRCQGFDVILLDFRLPDMSGLEVLNVLQQQHPYTPVIMLTGHGDEQVAVQAMKGGAQDYLIKDGLNQEVLQRTVRSVVNQARLQQQLHKNRERQRLIGHMALRIRQSLELDQTLETAVTEVRQLLQCDRVLAYQFAPDMSGAIIAESVGAGWTSALGEIVQDTYFQNQGAEEYRHGRRQVVADIQTAGLDPCHVDLLSQFEVRAILITPILIRAEDPETHQLWGLIVAHQCSKARQWQADEVNLLDELSIHVAIAIQQAELLAQTQAALEKEKVLNTFKSQIIATVSHEYNAPLTAIQVAAETLKAHHQTLATPMRQRFLDMIEQKSKHMSALVSDMLVVNQAELNQLKLHPVPLDLGQFLSKLIEEQQWVSPDQHRITLAVRGDMGGFKGDRGLLRQVFGNLLSNAVKYSPAGGSVRVQLIGSETHLVCHIKDEGIGIPAGDQQRLFQSFSRGSNVGTIPGTGLGLHIAKIAVDLHDGTIGIDSQVGQGTRLTVQLPKPARGTDGISSSLIADDRKTSGAGEPETGMKSHP
jgi:signal transduction histidine kinase/DNA-binding NarL/FixJ family response regulator